MGQTSSAAVDQSAAGPPGNRYWNLRAREPSWILRERLLNGDANGVFELLDLSEQNLQNLQTEQDSFSEGMQNFLSWSNQVNVSAKPSLIGSMKSVDLKTLLWSDDRNNTVVHYLAMGRSRCMYVSEMTHYPVVGANSFPGPNEADSREGRQLIFSMLLTSGRLDVSCLNSLNARGATPFHIAASVGNADIIQIFQSSAGDLADSLLYHRDSAGHAPSDAALLHGHVRFASSTTK